MLLRAGGDVTMNKATSWPASVQGEGVRVDGKGMGFWMGQISLVLLPSTVCPIAMDTTKERPLPIGVQIVGRGYGDRTTLRFAELLEEAGLSGCRAPPGFGM